MSQLDISMETGKNRSYIIGERQTKFLPKQKNTQFVKNDYTTKPNFIQNVSQLDDNNNSISYLDQMQAMHVGRSRSYQNQKQIVNNSIDVKTVFDKNQNRFFGIDSVHNSRPASNSKPFVQNARNVFRPDYNNNSNTNLNTNVPSSMQKAFFGVDPTPAHPFQKSIKKQQQYPMDNGNSMQNSHEIPVQIQKAFFGVDPSPLHPFQKSNPNVQSRAMSIATKNDIPTIPLRNNNNSLQGLGGKTSNQTRDAARNQYFAIENEGDDQNQNQPTSYTDRATRDNSIQFQQQRQQQYPTSVNQNQVLRKAGILNKGQKSYQFPTNPITNQKFHEKLDEMRNVNYSQVRNSNLSHANTVGRTMCSLVEQSYPRQQLQSIFNNKFGDKYTGYNPIINQETNYKQFMDINRQKLQVVQPPHKQYFRIPQHRGADQHFVNNTYQHQQHPQPYPQPQYGGGRALHNGARH